MVYVMADIHGMQVYFDDVLEQIQLQPEDSLYILGDVIDRGDQGIPLLQRLMQMDNVGMLLGNHEHMMLQALEHPSESHLQLWYHNGGGVTHRQFNRCSEQEQAGMLDYLRGLPLNRSLRVGAQDYLLVHGAPAHWYTPEHSPFRSRSEFAVWERLQPGSWREPDRVLLFGHTPTRYYQSTYPFEIWRWNTMVGLDCGCAMGTRGRLACLRLDDGAVFYSRPRSVGFDGF